MSVGVLTLKYLYIIVVYLTGVLEKVGNIEKKGSLSFPFHSEMKSILKEIFLYQEHTVSQHFDSSFKCYLSS